MVTPKFFAYVDAPADQLTPEADIVALFSEGVYEGNTGQRFTGFAWTVPDHANESVYGLVIPDNFEFTRIIANPDTFHEDVTGLWPQQVDLDFNGVTFHQYIAIDPLDWAAGGAGQRRYALEGGDIPAGGGLISPITAGSLREHIQTDLSNTALQRLLDGANGLVNRQYGEPEQQRVTLAPTRAATGRENCPYPNGRRQSKRSNTTAARLTPPITLYPPTASEYSATKATGSAASTPTSKATASTTRRPATLPSASTASSSWCASTWPTPASSQPPWPA